jgi:hypothetical protein
MGFPNGGWRVRRPCDVQILCYGSDEHSRVIRSNIGQPCYCVCAEVGEGASALNECNTDDAHYKSLGTNRTLAVLDKREIDRESVAGLLRQCLHHS